MDINGAKALKERLGEKAAEETPPARATSTKTLRPCTGGPGQPPEPRKG